MTPNLLRIVKSELVYSWRSGWPILPLTAGIFIYAYFREFNPLNLTTFVYFVMAVSLLFMNNFKENRSRMLHQLPVTPTDLAAARIFLTVIIFIFLFSIAAGFYVVFDWTAPGFRNSIYELLMFGAVGLLTSLIYFFLSDAFSIFKSRSAFRYFNVFAGVVAGLAVILISVFVSEVFSRSIVSGIITLAALYVLAVSLMVVSAYSYIKKESYLGSSC